MGSVKKRKNRERELTMDRNILTEYVRKTDKAQIENGFCYDQEQEYYPIDKTEDSMIPRNLLAKGSSSIESGIYEVEVNIKANTNIHRIFLFSNSRQLRDIISLEKGKCYKKTFFQSITQLIPDFEKECQTIESIYVTACVKETEEADVYCSFKKADTCRRIFICGDSTVTNQSARKPYLPGSSYGSWGQALPYFLEGRIAVDNQAHSGQTSKICLEEGHFQIVMDHIRQGDLCLIQFGHNDQKCEDLKASEGYRKRILLMISKLREKGAVPVLVTPLARNTWDAQGEYKDLLENYAQEIGKIGKEFQVPVIDIHQYAMQIWKQLGFLESTSYFYPNDYTHTNDFGSYMIAKKIAEELSEKFPAWIQLRLETDAMTVPKHLWERLQKVEKHIGESVPLSESERYHKMEMSLQSLLDSTF